MPRPQPRTITFTIDGLEVRAPENAMLVDAAKLGDVEIPVFCYEPKLGNPVGACRMCLVEIDGIPKLQTGCSTPVKDGMVVYTQTDRVKVAQQSVVEFLLINHPLDCPVCDKGGECPLQDITFGWGSGISRFIEPKRHFVKPLELSPLIAIDRERCILCYRCVRFSQEISEDYQLVLLERGAESYVATFDGHPYVAPFSGNIVELCPVGALTSRPYRFRARPWDIEGSGSVCTLCPSQCNVSVTVRDERALRVLAREHAGVDDGWLCDKGHFGYQSFHVPERITEPLLRDGGSLRPVSWERALVEAAAGLARAGERAAAIAGGQATNEEGHLLARLMREALGSPHVDSRRGGSLPLELHRALGEPALQARVSDLEFAHAVLVLAADPVNDAPILDLRLRKGVRRHGLQLAQAMPAETSLEASAKLSLRFAPGQAAAFAAGLAAALVDQPDAAELERLAGLAGSDAAQLGELAALLKGTASAADESESPREVVILFGERLLSGPDGAAGATALLQIAERLGIAEVAGSGLLEIPSGANGRGLREAGVLPNAGPGYAEPALAGGRDAHAIAEGLASGELHAVYLLQSDPLRELPDAQLWRRALAGASTVIAHAEFMSETVAEHADVVFPAEVYAEKEGTVVHPDGRLQRLRPAIARAGEVRAGWRVISELALRLGLDLDVLSAKMASQRLFDAVPFYAQITLEEIGGRGVRWQERAAAASFPAGARVGEQPPPLSEPDGDPATALRAREIAGFRSVWDAPEVEHSPALEFLAPRRELVSG
jgi:NADH-quinone oxidoreductase subunit G